MLLRRQRPRLAAAVGRRLGRAVADDAGVDAAPGQLAAQTAEFDLRAAVHDHFEAGRLGLCGGLVVADAQLHPDHLGADGDGVVDDRSDRIRGAEDIDHVDLVGNVAQTGVDLLAQLLLARGAGIDRDDAVAFALQILHHEVAGPVPVGRGADHGDGAHRRQDAAQLRVGVGDRIECGHLWLPSARVGKARNRPRLREDVPGPAKGRRPFVPTHKGCGEEAATRTYRPRRPRRAQAIFDCIGERDRGVSQWLAQARRFQFYLRHATGYPFAASAENTDDRRDAFLQPDQLGRFR